MRHQIHYSNEQKKNWLKMKKIIERIIENVSFSLGKFKEKIEITNKD